MTREPMNLTDALSALQHAAGAAGGPAPVTTILRRRQRRTVARRGGAVALGVTAVAAAAVGLPSLQDAPSPVLPVVTNPSPTQPAPTATATPTQTATPTPTPEPSATTAPTAPPTGGEAALPLRDPLRWWYAGGPDGGSPVPTSDTELGDGDWFGFLGSVDVPGRTITFDVAILYTGRDDVVEQWNLRHPDSPLSPDEPTDWTVVNDVERERVLPVADDVVVATYCVGADEPTNQLRDFAEWATAERGAGGQCSAEPDPMVVPSGSDYWVAIRGGEVVQIVQQYFP